MVLLKCLYLIFQTSCYDHVQSSPLIMKSIIIKNLLNWTNYLSPLSTYQILLYWIMKRKFKQWWSTIPSISTKRTITSHLTWLTEKKDHNIHMMFGYNEKILCPSKVITSGLDKCCMVNYLEGLVEKRDEDYVKLKLKISFWSQFWAWLWYYTIHVILVSYHSERLYWDF